MSSLQFLAETHVFGIVIHPWKIVGLTGSLVFGLRFLIQWIASERAKKSVIPFGFWECSALGEPADAELFCDLPAGFRRRVEHRDASPDLSAQSLFPLHPPVPAASRQRAPPAGIGATVRFTSPRLGLKLLTSMISSEQIIYLDNNATTQLDPAVIEEMLPFLTKYYGNPSSGYGCSVRKCGGAVDLARQRVAALLGCEPAEIVFTSCGTESNNAAVNSALQLDPARQHIVTTAVEHSATSAPLRYALKTRVPGHDRRRRCARGISTWTELERAITPQTAIISAMWANNETGVLFPVEKSRRSHGGNRVLFHTDAIQVVGKIPIRLADSTINSLSLSAHKLHGPKGVGALYVRKRSLSSPP